MHLRKCKKEKTFYDIENGKENLGIFWRGTRFHIFFEIRRFWMNLFYFSEILTPV